MTKLTLKAFALVTALFMTFATTTFASVRSPGAPQPIPPAGDSVASLRSPGAPQPIPPAGDSFRSPGAPQPIPPAGDSVASVFGSSV